MLTWLAHQQLALRYNDTQHGVGWRGHPKSPLAHLPA